MAGGKYSFAIAPLLLLSFFGSTRTAPTGNITSYMATHKKIFITADQMDVVISSTLETKVILQKLETLSAENKELAKKFQALEKRVLTLEGRVGNVFLFPQKGVTDYVIVPGMRSLSAVTACFWMKTADTVNTGTPLSYAVPGTDNEFIVYNYKSFQLFVGSDSRNTGISAIDGGWHHICATWENTAGSWKLYKDGVVASHGQGLKKGYVIRGAGSLVLGQEQDSVAGSFNAAQSFIGEMAGVNVWSRVLGSYEIATMAQSSCTAGVGNVFKWSDFISSRRGGVQLIHASCPF